MVYYTWTIIVLKWYDIRWSQMFLDILALSPGHWTQVCDATGTGSGQWTPVAGTCRLLTCQWKVEKLYQLVVISSEQYVLLL